MSDYHRARRLKPIQQPHEVPDKMQHRVLINRLRTVALAVTAHVRGDRMKAVRGERIDLVTPGAPTFRKAVAQQDKRSLALLDDIQADAIGLDGPLDQFAR
jgi:hypothetical protein